MNSLLTQCVWAVPICILTCSTFAEESQISTSEGIISGDVGLVSQYIYRGGVENNDIAIQGGVEYAHKSGFSVGYWGSTLDYDSTDEQHDHGFEHDIYLAYHHQISKDWSYKLQTTAYLYQNGGTVYAEGNDHRRTTAFDVLAEVAYKDLSLNAAVILADASFEIGRAHV